MRLQATATLSRRAASALLPLLFSPLPLPAEDVTPPATAVAYFSAGDPRFLQPTFDDIAYLGVTQTSVGTVVDAAGAATPALRVEYKPKKLGYKRILGAYWRGVDPTKKELQFGDPTPTIIWVTSPEERELANDSLRRLDKSGMYKAPIVTALRDAKDVTFEANDQATGWYKTNEKKYEQAMKKSGRSAWFENAYKPITVTACGQVDEAGVKGNVCGFVYFPCTEENGCRAVMQGTW